MLTPFKIIGDKLGLWDLVVVRHGSEVYYSILRTTIFGDKRVSRGGVGHLVLEDGGKVQGERNDVWRYYDEKKHKASQVMDSLATDDDYPSGGTGGTSTMKAALKAAAIQNKFAATAVPADFAHLYKAFSEGQA